MASKITRTTMLLLLAVLPVIEGCGAIFLGKTQQIAVRTTPPGAVASLAAAGTDHNTGQRNYSPQPT